MPCDLDPTFIQFSEDQGFRVFNRFFESWFSTDCKHVTCCRPTSVEPTDLIPKRHQNALRGQDCKFMISQSVGGFCGDNSRCKQKGLWLATDIRWTGLTGVICHLHTCCMVHAVFLFRKRRSKTHLCLYFQYGYFWILLACYSSSMFQFRCWKIVVDVDAEKPPYATPRLVQASCKQQNETVAAYILPIWQPKEWIATHALVSTCSEDRVGTFFWQRSRKGQWMEVIVFSPGHT